jgi:alkaline phosphatase D
MTARKLTRYLWKAIFILTLLANFFPILGEKKGKASALKIAFGSCMDQNMDKSIWKVIQKTEPHFWIWLGDNIYKDTLDMDEKKAAYDLQKSDPGYVKLTAKTKILGIWDDHDFGFNDVGAEYPFKKESKDLFLNFLDIPKKSELYQREGTYSSEMISFDGMRIKLVLLDTRTFRTPLKTNWYPYFGEKKYVENEDEDATILGSAQWIWLEEELKTDSDLVIILSSIQVLNDTHRFEKWGNFPLEKMKLTSLIDHYASGKTFILSGDRHIAEIFEENLPSGKLLPDITSSSMNKPIPQRGKEVPDDRRKTLIYTKSNFGQMEIQKMSDYIEVKISIRGMDETAIQRAYRINRLVGDTGIEPVTSTMSR